MGEPSAMTNTCLRNGYPPYKGPRITWKPSLPLLVEPEKPRQEYRRIIARRGLMRNAHVVQWESHRSGYPGACDARLGTAGR
jgi:hypothetical protein